MILIVCSCCKKVIGCGVTKNGHIKKTCYHCYHIGCPFYSKEQVIKIDVIIISFENGCMGHDPPPIGFHLGGK